MDPKTWIIGSVTVAFVSWTIKHIASSCRHPRADKIVFKEVCDAKMDCVEKEVKALTKSQCEFREDTKCDFQKMDKRFDRLEDLIRDDKA